VVRDSGGRQLELSCVGVHDSAAYLGAWSGRSLIPRRRPPAKRSPSNGPAPSRRPVTAATVASARARSWSATTTDSKKSRSTAMRAAASPTPIIRIRLGQAAFWRREDSTWPAMTQTRAARNMSVPMTLTCTGVPRWEAPHTYMGNVIELGLALKLVMM